MNEFLTDDTNAVLLLCCVFGKNRSAKPLTQTEYTALVHWLIRVEMRPCDLLQNNNVADAALGAKLNKQRLESLLGRGVQLGFAVEEWQRNGVWIISRSDPVYPARYKKHLKDKAPPLLFGVGKRALLSAGGLAIIGSRNVDQQGEIFTRDAAKLCALNGMPVVSGGARGVDQLAMTASLDASGVSIAVVAENLLKKSLKRSARYAIADGRLLLISPYLPQARFTVGTAMARNKLIYALADYGLVVSAEHKKGGTWAGASEELKRENPRTVFVRTGNHVPPGNSKLLELGAIAWPEAIESDDLKRQLADLAHKNQGPKMVKQQNIFAVIEKRAETTTTTEHKDNIKSIGDNKVISDKFSKKVPASIYHAVLPVILDRIESPMNSDQLAKLLNVSKSQLNKWLKRAVKDGFIRKYSRPVRYEKRKEDKAQQNATLDRY